MKNFRNMMRFVISCIFIWSGMVRIYSNKAKSNHHITSIYFHDPSNKLFERCVQWLINNEYYFVSLDELHRILIRKEPIQKGAVCLTVDDGWKDNLVNIVPVIEKYSIPICFFISTEPVETGAFWWSYIVKSKELGLKETPSIGKFKSMPEFERSFRLRELKRGIQLQREAMTKEDVAIISCNPLITIGSHTVHHAYADRCSVDELLFEIKESKRLLSQWTQKEVKYFSYPNGKITGKENDMLFNNGYLMAFTTKVDLINIKQHDLYYLPRFCLNDNGTFRENICKMVGVWQHTIGHLTS